MICAEDAELNV